jgi:hypothetical protein
MPDPNPNPNRPPVILNLLSSVIFLCRSSSPNPNPNPTYPPPSPLLFQKKRLAGTGRSTSLSLSVTPAAGPLIVLLPARPQDRLPRQSIMSWGRAMGQLVNQDHLKDGTLPFAGWWSGRSVACSCLLPCAMAPKATRITAFHQTRLFCTL